MGTDPGWHPTILYNSMFKDVISGEMADIYIISPSFGMPIDALIVQDMFLDVLDGTFWPFEYDAKRRSG